MADRRRHRGPHPEDRRLFAAGVCPTLVHATRDLSWLLSHGYASRSTLKLVGDRYALVARQRVAVARCACSEQAASRRQSHEVTRLGDIEYGDPWIDGYNVLISIEAALSNGVILRGRDGCYRDMASMHGSYRRVAETIAAIRLLGQLLADWNIPACRWLLDEPVSNSGRLARILRETADQHGWSWQVELVPDPDKLLARTDQVVVSSDSGILDAADRWFNLVRRAIDGQIPDAWIVDLS